MRNIQAVISLCTVILALFLQPVQADAQNTSRPAESMDFMCRAKAKEIAAETYSTCINDNKQAELERIRLDYQAELAQIKAKYEGEIKSLSPSSSPAKAQPAAIKETAPAKSSKPKPQARTQNTRARKAAKPQKVVTSTVELKEMPAKKMRTSKVRVERIDFSSSQQDSAPADNALEGLQEQSVDALPLQSRLDSDSHLMDPEIVEIPIQEE